MAPNVEIISKEIIKPSSPTPDHLRNLKLSFLDQVEPPVYVPLIFFYQFDELCFDADKSKLLKQSLSNTLTMFYPLAGRIHENSSIDCNDSGVEFIEARVHAVLSNVIHKSNMEELKKLLAVDPIGIVFDTLLAVQINFFDCGGIAIGVCLSHQIADGTSLVEFMNTWAATCRGKAKIVQPCFDLARSFPPKDLLGSGFTPNILITKEKIVTKRFVFDKEKLAKLKEVAASGDGSQVQDPTRVEAVSAHIWKQFMEIAKNKIDEKKALFFALHAVNLRPRTSPPLSEHAFGNCWWPAIAVSTSSDDNNGFSVLVTMLRNAIRKINSDYMEQVKEDYLNHLSKLSDLLLKGDVELYNFTSWCRFPVYEVDYGWGKPCWVCTTTLPIKNIVILMNTPCGDGIEAWVNMLEQDMEMLESHQKSTGYA
ncbi:HXXXD-type acyl-transferase family protein [Forsythia ovata]|uniref:HXXXD-type acyl-transferase family protein n=1 Tax=Forsythia ovata TaxID=205694 RepID=A0ABD1TR68_9LAMI